MMYYRTELSRKSSIVENLVKKKKMEGEMSVSLRKSRFLIYRIALY